MVSCNFDTTMILSEHTFKYLNPLQRILWYCICTMIIPRFGHHVHQSNTLMVICPETQCTFCTIYCTSVISSINMIINMTALFVLCTGTLGAVNMRVNGRLVIWRVQQWSSVTIIHSKRSRYIHNSHKYSLNVLFNIK